MMKEHVFFIYINLAKQTSVLPKAFIIKKSTDRSVEVKLPAILGTDRPTDRTGHGEVSLAMNLFVRCPALL